jgi:uncharacterized protein YutE (UPF0331/DUF86 family)
MKKEALTELLKKRHVRIAYLLGSQKESGISFLDGKISNIDEKADLDIGVILEKPPQDIFEVYGGLYAELSILFGPFNVDLVLLHETDILFQYEAIKGKLIYCEDEDFLDEYEELVMKMASDLSFKKVEFEKDFRIEQNLSLIQGFLSELKKLSEISEEEFLRDKRNPAASESYLRRSLEAVFDIGRHILSKSYGFKEIEYKKIAMELGERGVLDKEYAMTLLKMAGYRNRMVHLYHEVTPHEIYNILQGHLSDIDHFIKEIVNFLESYKRDVGKG